MKIMREPSGVRKWGGLCIAFILLKGLAFVAEIVSYIISQPRSLVVAEGKKEKKKTIE